MMFLEFMLSCALVTLFDHRKDSLRNGLEATGFEQLDFTECQLFAWQNDRQEHEGPLQLFFCHGFLAELFAGGYVSSKKQVINYTYSL